MTDIKIVADTSDIQTMRRELVGVAKDAKSSARVFEAEFSRVERELTRAAKANQNFYNSTLKVGQSTKSASASAKVFSQELRKHEIEAKKADAATKQLTIANDALRQKYDSGYRASVLFKRELRELVKAKQQGYIAADRYQKEVAQLKQEFRDFGAQAKGVNAMTNRFAANTAMAGRRTNQLGVIMQQTGYQVGDFAVQVQSGTHFMVALGQQATQLVGTFAMLARTTRMIAIFSGLGIAIPILTAVAGAIMRTRRDAEESADGIMTYAGALKRAREEAKRTRQELAALRGGFADVLEYSLDSQIEKLESDLFPIMEKYQSYLREQATLIREQGLVTEDELIEALTDAALQYRNNTEEGQRLLELEKELAELRSARREKEYADRLAESARTMAEIRGETVRVTEATIKLTENLGGAGIEYIAIQRALDEGVISAEQLAGVDLTSALSPAVREATELAKQLGISVRLALALSGGIQRNEEVIMDPRHPRYDPQAARLAQLQAMMDSGELYNSTTTSGTTGGGSRGGSGFKPQEFMTGLVDKALEQMENTMVEKINQITSHIGTAFESVITGAKSVGEAFRDMVYQMLLDLWRQNVAQPMVSSITSSIANFLFAAKGGAFNKGVQMFADGGVVGSPTMFRHSGGVGMMGEAGPEAIMPLKRGRNGKLGVQMEGSQGNVTVHNHFNLSANGDESVKKLIAQAAPQIAKMTKSSLLDDRRRGGATRAAFG